MSRKFLIFSLALLFQQMLLSQGLYTDFGQNRIQNNQKLYTLQYDDKTVIFYNSGEELAQFTLSKIREYLPKYESIINYNLNNGITIVVYNNYLDYLNSPIHLSNDQMIAKGQTSLKDNVSSVYFDGSIINFENQIKKSISEVIITEFIYGGNIRERVQTAALLNLPDWYIKGVTSYLAESWNIEKDNLLKDFFSNNRQKQFTHLNNEEEHLVGHSIWRYIEEKYGSGSVNNIVFLTRLSRNVNNAFTFYLGLDLVNLIDDWENFYLEKYIQDEATFKLPKGQENSPKKISLKRHTQFKISNSGNELAIVTNENGRYHIYIYNIKTKKIKTIAKGGHILNNKEYSVDYPIISWHPKNNHLSYITYSNDKSYLHIYNIQNDKHTNQELKDVPLIKEYDFHPEGEKIILSVINKNKSDLMEYNLKSNSFKWITNDVFDDKNPRYSFNGKEILFSSNRNFNFQFVNVYSLFKINEKQEINYLIGDNDKITNYHHPISLKNNDITFLSDKNGIINNFLLKNNNIYQLTNYKRSINYNDISIYGNKIADLILYKGKYRIFVAELTENLIDDSIINPKYTSYKNQLLNKILFSDTAAKEFPKSIQKVTENTNDTNKTLYFLSEFTEFDNIESSNSEVNSESVVALQDLKLNFGVNYFVQHIDNSILNNYYFNAQSDPRIYNIPLLSFLFQTSISDQIKNNVIEAGFRQSINLSVSEQYIKYLYRKTRWNKTISAFRRSRSFSSNTAVIKYLNTGINLGLLYPFSERSSFHTEVFSRYDRNLFSAIDLASLNNKSAEFFYSGFQFKWIYDNTINSGNNIQKGVKLKVFQENFFNVNNSKFISNLGFDFRYYKTIFKKTFIANRSTGSFSFGSQKIAFYIGGVENQIKSQRDTTFIYENIPDNFNKRMPLLNSEEYAFQTLVSPLRGFLRNTRSGSRYFVNNLELRVPLAQTFYNKPIQSEFINSFMMVGFVDFGVAWIGNSPYSADNPYNTLIYKNPGYTITASTIRNPFLYSFGFGLRAKLLGHYLKYDIGWGVLEEKIQTPLSTFSLGFDF